MQPATISMVTPLTFARGDDDLIDALRAAHPGAAALFYDRYATAVHRTLQSVLGRDAEIPDLLQEVFIRAIGNHANCRAGDLSLAAQLTDHGGLHLNRVGAGFTPEVLLFCRGDCDPCYRRRRRGARIAGPPDLTEPVPILSACSWAPSSTIRR